MNEDPGDNLDVVTARSCGQMIEMLQKHHTAGNRHRTIAASEGYIEGIRIWLNAAVGGEAAFNILTRQIDAITAETARERHLQEQG